LSREDGGKRTESKSVEGGEERAENREQGAKGREERLGCEVYKPELLMASLLGAKTV
jgi:hypothetical protein